MYSGRFPLTYTFDLRKKKKKKKKKKKEKKKKDNTMSLSSNASIFATFAIALGALGVALLVLPRVLPRSKAGEAKEVDDEGEDPRLCARTRSNSTTVADVRGLAGKGTFEPPLPPPLMCLLARCSLCQLATVSDANAPHLSLMRFTYDPLTDVIVMSTRRLTKKFSNLQRNKRVSLLLTDFQDQGRGVHAATGTISVTIEGALSITTAGSEEETRFRSLHLEHNKGYEQFIKGKDIAIVVVKVLSARICDIEDNVRHWSRSESDRS